MWALISQSDQAKTISEPNVIDLRCIKYLPNGDVQYKLDHGDKVWLSLAKPRLIHIEEPLSLLPEKLTIKQTKYQHLQQLKRFIPNDYHLFYDSCLKH